MRNSQYFQSKSVVGSRLASLDSSVPKKFVVGLILLIALIAFEIFNFDTSQYALHSLLGEVEFLGLQWATILAVAFCAIDFAGLIRIFTPEQGLDEPKEVWYLTGAWLLGATMNAILTWWAVSIALLNRNMGNEILSREQLLLYVPIFVAVLVWLTRILFIGAFSVAGEHIFDFHTSNESSQNYQRKNQTKTGTSRKTAVQPRSTRRTTPRTRAARPAPKPRSTMADQSGYVEELQYEPIAAQPTQTGQPQAPKTQSGSRVRQRPPRPASRRPAIHGVQARPRNNKH